MAAIVTEWNQFRMLDHERMKERMARPVLVDMRNIYDGDTLRGLGFSYTGFGV